MRRLFLTSTAIVGVVVVSVATQGQPPGGEATKRDFQQAPAAAALDAALASIPKDWKVGRTAWGDPDLQGVWSYATTTPLSLREGQQNRQLTADEIAEDEERQARQAESKPRPGDPGTYNDHWFDRGKSVGRPSLIVDPPDGRLPPLTPEGEKARAARIAYEREHPADSHLDRSPTDRCIVYHGVPPLPSGYSNTYQIFQTPGLVAILDEEIHHVRMVPVDGRPPAASTIRRWNGVSRGRWEGDTLVVETTNFNDKTRLRYGGSSNTQAVERFKRLGPDLIDYRYTITDPTVFTKPFTVAIPMPRRNDKLYEYACHEGNHAMTGILSGARMAEKEAAEQATNKRGPGRSTR